MDEPGIYEAIVRMRCAGLRGVLATVVRAKGSAPRHACAKMLVQEDGSTLGTIGGGALEAEVLRRADACFKSGLSELHSFDLGGRDKDSLGMVCGGEVDVFLELIGAHAKFLVFGAGHISKALVPILKLLGIKVTVVDERAELLNVERFPDADGMVVNKVENAFKELVPDPSTGIAILTQSHRLDKTVLRWAVMTEAGYIGVIGSNAKIQLVLASLIEEGIPEERLQHVHGPIGLPINSETPAEIAVAIAAQVVAHHRNAKLSKA